MALYLSMDGVDDRIVTPTISYNKVVFDVYVTPPSATVYLLDPTNRTDAGYIRVLTSSFANNVGTLTGQAFSTRTTITLTVPAVKTYALSFFGAMAGGSFLSGKLYDIKIYNGETIVAHYDMKTGNVQDQSGNGKHATLTGGTWLDDGGGTPTGTDGSTEFDLRQSLFADSAVNADSRQSFYSDSVTAFDSVQAIYSDSATGCDTRLTLYQDGLTAFDTLQEFFSDGIVGSTPFDLRFVLYADNSAVFDSRQAVYTDGVSAADLSQQFYATGGISSDMKLVLYADASIKADTTQRYYTDGNIDFDTLQSILDNWVQYNEVIRIVLNISRKQTSDISITRKQNATLGITQRNQSELNL